MSRVKTVSGASVGVLMLESRFPRIPGDGGNAGTWPFPVLFSVVRGATPERVVTEGARDLLEPFIEAGRDLVRTGADGLTTSCGFLAPYQRDLADACAVPVAASALLQIPWVQSLLPRDRRVGVVTVSGEALEARHLLAAGAPADTPVVGTEAGRELSAVLIGNRTGLDVERAREDVLEAGDRLVRSHPDVGAVVIECTNMPPYAADLADRLGLPVYDFYSLVTWFQAGLAPRRF